MSILHENDDGVARFDEKLLELIKFKNKDEVQSILQGVSGYHQLRDSNGRTLLHFASEWGNSEFAQHLISLGADVDAQDHEKQTPLMLALDCFQEKSVFVLLEANADLYVPNIHGKCALGKAFTIQDDIKYGDHLIDLDVDGKISIDKYMELEKGNLIVPAIFDRITVASLENSEYVACDVFHRDCPLYHFMQLNNAEVTKVLLEKGCPIDTKYYSGLHTAVKCLSSANVKLLLKYGVDVNARDIFWDNQTSLSIYPVSSGESEAPEVIKILIEAGAILIDTEYKSIIVKEILQQGTKEMVSIILNYPIDLEFIDKEGMTPLHYLIDNWRYDFTNELRSKHFNVDRHYSFRNTLLHYAAREGNPAFVRLLLDRGASINALNQHHQTPLFYAGISQAVRQSHRTFSERFDYFLKCIEIFLERGADPDIFSRYYKWPYYSSIHIADELVTPILTKLVLLEASDQALKYMTQSKIKEDPRFKSIYDSVQLQIEQIKQIEIVNSVTLLDFLTGSDDKIIKFARNKNLYLNLTNLVKEYNCSTVYYQRRLKRLFSKFSQFIEWRKTYESVMNEVLSEIYNLSVDNIAEKIIDYLQYEKWIELG